ncbi:MAG: hypothetical protein FJX44_03005 [Alphaproteobacteria bacterium]|nr:hypothetical protein [Alphaproteobacteria bacterium]
MNRNIAIVAGLIAVATMLSATPASAAASSKARKACEKKAELVLPALRAEEKEAYIANCLANATTTR